MMTTCNRPDLESLGSWPTMYAQKLPGYWSGQVPETMSWPDCVGSALKVTHLVLQATWVSTSTVIYSHYLVSLIADASIFAKSSSVRWRHVLYLIWFHSIPFLATCNWRSGGRPGDELVPGSMGFCTSAICSEHCRLSCVLLWIILFVSFRFWISCGDGGCNCWPVRGHFEQCTLVCCSLCGFPGLGLGFRV